MAGNEPVAVALLEPSTKGFTYHNVSPGCLDATKKRPSWVCQIVLKAQHALIALGRKGFPVISPNVDRLEESFTVLIEACDSHL